jgi:hypothetical protein
VQADFLVVVAIERHVQRSQRHCEAERPVQPLGEPHAPGMDADETCLRPDFGPHFLGERLQELFGVG